MVSFLTMAASLTPFCNTGMQMFVAGASIMMVFGFAYYPIRLLGIDKYLEGNVDDWPLEASNLFFLFPPIAIAHIFWQLQEADSIGVQLATDEDLVMNAIYMMLLSTPIWAFVTFYFEQIMPQAHGPAIESSKMFFLESKWWKKSFSSNGARVEESQGVDCEAGGGGVKIDNLVKVFKTGTDEKNKNKELRAIDGLTVNFPNNEVTAVLGHNGAGKTTTIRCMTASETPTSGSITINGIDAIANKDWVKSNVGVCPQHDVLYDELTAKEHVDLFGTMKGVPFDAVETLSLVDLQGEAE